MKHTLLFSEKAVTVHEYGNHSNRALLFIHGNSVPSSFFIPLVQFLEANYYIITLDLPGHRQSEAWEKEDFTPKILRRYLIRFLNTSISRMLMHLDFRWAV